MRIISHKIDEHSKNGFDRAVKWTLPINQKPAKFNWIKIKEEPISL